MTTVYCAYPSAFIHKTPGEGKIQQLIWGDWIDLRDSKQGDWVKVYSRRTEGWMRENDIQQEKLLEVNFVDIGQGDGCFIVTPDDKFILLDAGEGDNMFRFLRWRFSLKEDSTKMIRFHCAIISHSDTDHFRGFEDLFKSKHFHFETVYHNGIVDRVEDDPLGPTCKVGGRTYLTDVILDRDGLNKIIDDSKKVGKKVYPKMLKAACKTGRVGEIRMICSEDGYLPGYDSGHKLAIRILGPVPEKGPQGKRLLRWYGEPGKTKNGHSVVVKMEYGNVKMLLGGDLNIPAEEYLLEHYTGLDPHSKTPAAEENLIEEARKVFESDISKVCHHGSADFTDLFLRSIHAIGWVISSGDDEPHCHPRPDSLGALGRAGRGDRPLIFSTELARSTRELIKHPQAMRNELNELITKKEKAPSEKERKAVQKKIDDLLGGLDRSVAVYGLINLRTDGKKAVLAQKLERPRATREEFDVHRLEPDANGRLQYVSKY